MTRWGRTASHTPPEPPAVPPRDGRGPRWEITQEEIAQVIQSLPNRKAPGITGVPNSFPKAMGPQLAAALALVTQACLDWEYYPRAFKTARTVAFRKPGKGDYQAPKSWRPIALLETLGKVVEAIIATRIRDFAESMGLLPEAQMGTRQGRSTETAVASLLARVRAAWDSGGAVASVLALDVSGAFDRVLKERLIWALRQRGFPGLFITGSSPSCRTGRLP